jgi:hypothetical protein
MTAIQTPEREELRKLLGREPGTCHAEELVHNRGNAATGGIWRVRGDGWSFVVKLLRRGHDPSGRWETSDDPQHWNYWRRESLVYETGLAAEAYVPAGIEPPRLHGLYERRPDLVALWLEDVSEPPATSWAPADFELAARRLGRAQGASPVPDAPWLSRGWLASYIDSKQADPSLLDGGLFDPSLSARLRRLWHERERLLAILDDLPQTLCHLDVWPRNLFGDAHRTVLVDWAFAGKGAIGEDPSNLILDSFFDGLLPLALLDEVEHAVERGYFAGLRDAGWPGSVDEVRLGITAAAVKYCWLAPTMLARIHARGHYDARSGRELFAGRAPVLARACDWADEALSA